MFCRPVFLLVALTLSGCARRTGPPTLTVSVAASLHPVITSLPSLYTGAKIEFNFGGSGALAHQIESGAPADIFISAGPRPIEQLAAKSLLLPGTRRDLLRNTVVLIASNTSITSFQSLAGSTVKHIAIGDPASVPAGDYARQVLTSLALWQPLQSKLVLAPDVRHVLTYVATGNADAGIVYGTDAAGERGVRTVGPAPPGTHEPVVYPAAVVARTREPEAARRFLEFLAGAQAQAKLREFGFAAP